MRIIRASEQVAVPWKNGAGVASAIAGEPEGTGYEAFDWRLSGALVERGGPFSHFPDVDRIMLILSSGRLVLDGIAPAPVVLDAGSAPLAFPGDVTVTATLPEGPIRNLNLMTDRRRLTASAERLTITSPVALTAPDGGRLIVYGEAGFLSVAGHRLEAGDTLVAREGVTLGGDGRAIIFRLAPRIT